MNTFLVLFLLSIVLLLGPANAGVVPIDIWPKRYYEGFKSIKYMFTLYVCLCIRSNPIDPAIPVVKSENPPWPSTSLNFSLRRRHYSTNTLILLPSSAATPTLRPVSTLPADLSPHRPTPSVTPATQAGPRPMGPTGLTI